MQIIAQTIEVAGSKIEISEGAVLATALIAIIFGALFCFFGYRIFRLTVAFVGGVIVGGGAGAAAYEISGGSATATTIATILGGMLGSFLAYKLYMIGVFLLGALLGFTLGTFIFAVALGPVNAIWVLILSVVLAVVAGVAALYMQRMLVVGATAFVGASWMLMGITAIIKGGDSLQKEFFSLKIGPYEPVVRWLDNPIYLGVLVFLGLIGAGLQVTTTAKRKLAEDKARIKQKLASLKGK